MTIEDPRLRKLVTVHMVVAANVLFAAAFSVGWNGETAKAAFAKAGREPSLVTQWMLMGRWAGFVILPVAMIGALIALRGKEPEVAWKLGIAYGVMALSAGWWLLGNQLLAA